jgi:hypothetical protein
VLSTKLVAPRFNVKALDPEDGLVTYKTRPAVVIVGDGTVNVKLPAVAVATTAELLSINDWVMVLFEPLE